MYDTNHRVYSKWKFDELKRHVICLVVTVLNQLRTVQYIIISITIAP